MVRGPYYDKNGVKRGAWSKEEDERLRAFVERYGHSNWRELPKLAGLSRCGKSCRRRWVNHLKPNVRRGHYTKEEDLIIIKLHEQHGNKWSLIAKKLPGRTDNDIKNQWHSRLKKLFQRNDHEMKSDFQMNPSDTSEGEITQYTESENSIPSGAPSYNILENWQPTYTETYGECSDIASWATFQIFSDFWTEPFIVENTQSLDNYGANGVYMDQYVSDLWDDTAELCDVMQELPNDPK